MSRRLAAPAAQHVLDAHPYPSSRSFAVDARHQQLVVVGVDVSDRRNDRETHGSGIKSPFGRAASDSSAATRRRVNGDRLAAVGGVTRELLADRQGELALLAGEIRIGIAIADLRAA
jgi:hypothetical protein